MGGGGGTGGGGGGGGGVGGTIRNYASVRASDEYYPSIDDFLSMAQMTHHSNAAADSCLPSGGGGGHFKPAS